MRERKREMASPLVQFLAGCGLAEQAQQMEAHGYDLETFKGMDGDDLTGLCDELQFPGGIKVRLKRALTQSAAGSATAAQGAPGAAPPTAAVVTSAPVTSAVVAPAAAALPATVVSSPATPGPALSLQPVSAPLSPSPCPPGTCGYCRTRPVFQGSPYCGKRCMGAATSAGWVNGSPPGQPAAGAVAGMCGFCRTRPVAAGHPYCGRGCATKAKAAGLSPPAATTPVAAAVVVSTAASPTGSPQQCAFCRSKPVAIGHPFCGQACAGHAQKAGWQGSTPPPSPTPAPAPATALASPLTGGGGVAISVASPLSPALPASPKIATYHVTFPFNPESPGTRITTDLTIEHVVPTLLNVSLAR